MSAVINSKNPANDGTLAGAFAEVLEKFSAQQDDMLPAEVVAYDRETNRASVKPLIKILKTDGTLLARADLLDVPCFALGCGLAVLHYNLQPGDKGWIKANDRDISLYLQSENDSPPNTLRKHNFSDSIFIPDALANWTLDPTDTDGSVVLQTADASQRIVLYPDRVRVYSDTLVEVDAPTVNTLGNTNLFGTGSDPGVARLGDAVQVTVPAFAFDVSIPQRTTPLVDTVVDGFITSASNNNTSS